MDPDTIRSLRSRIRMDLLLYCKGGSMISVDLSANCEGCIYDPNGSGIQILGIRSRDPFSGSTDMYAWNYISDLNYMLSADDFHLGILAHVLNKLNGRQLLYFDLARRCGAEASVTQILLNTQPCFKKPWQTRP